MQNILVYSKKNCPNCEILKQLLKRENIEYKTININTPEALTELYKNSVYAMSAPVLQIEGKFYTLREMATSGTIDQNIIMNIIEEDIRQIGQIA